MQAAGACLEAAGGACLEEAVFWGGHWGAHPCLALAGRAAVGLMGRVLRLACLPLPRVPQARPHGGGLLRSPIPGV